MATSTATRANQAGPADGATAAVKTPRLLKPPNRARTAPARAVKNGARQKPAATAISAATNSTSGTSETSVRLTPYPIRITPATSANAPVARTCRRPAAVTAAASSSAPAHHSQAVGGGR